jgi:hypothetical protein
LLDEVFDPFSLYNYCSPDLGEHFFAGVAQLVEQLIRNQQVSGSSPLAGFYNQWVCPDHRIIRIYRKFAAPRKRRTVPQRGVPSMLRHSLCRAVFALLSFGSAGYAQTGTITGTVTDAVGGVLPGVTITLTNTGTNSQRRVETDERGDYNVLLLPAGTYEIRAELSGFKTAIANNVRVSVDDRLRVNLSLAVGDAVDRILVTDATPLVQSESSSVGNLIDNQKVVELPLNGRRFESLSQLVPGSASAAPGSALRFRGGFTAAGARETANNNILDGVDNNDTAINSFTLRPIVDAIDEFKVLISSYSAEFGRAGGAQITVNTKSGTNQFHGAAWEFLRNDKLDARDFFNTKDSGPKPPFRRNQFGATIGGPVIHASTFFFLAFEGVRRTQQFASRQQVPTEALRRGDFSALTVTSPIRDPENPLTPPFPGNIIPANRIHPIARRILDRGSFPLPTPGLAVPNNFLAMNPYPNDVNQYNVRLDRRITRSNTLFGRYGLTSDALMTPCSGAGQTACLPGFGHNDVTRAQSLSLGDTQLLSPKLILEVRAGYNRERQSRIALTSGHNDISSEIGIPASQDPRDFGHPQIAITGFGTIGDRGYQDRAGTTVQMAGSLSYIAGPHAVHTGVELRRIMYYAGSNARETLRFSGIWTGNAFADFLLGFPSQTTRDPLNSFRYHILDSYNWFVEDDFAVSKRLTLNLGMRYEYNTPAVEKQDRLAQLNVVTLKYELAGKDGASRALYNPDKNNFGPRFGFAFRPGGTSKNVIRGGYGIFYDLASVGTSLASVRNGLPFQQPETFEAGISPNALTLSNPFLSARLNTIFDSPSMDPGFRDAYIQQWNFGFERQLPGNTVFEASYVGNKGTRLIRTVDINQAFPVPGVNQPPVQPRRPLPGYGAVPVLESSGSSIYHGLLGRVQRRFAGGLSLLSSYTYSHAIDDSSGGNVAQDARNLKADRGSSDFDARHRLVVSYVYELPFGNGKRFGNEWSSTLDTILGGWELSGIAAFESGRPIFIQLSPSNQISNTGSTRDRPNVGQYIENHYIETGIKPVIKKSTDKTVYLDRRAFSVPPRGSFGNTPRNYFNGPGTSNLDLMVGKNFRQERFNVQFRTELYNALNRPSLNQPNRNPDSSSFGTITSTLLENRQVQVGLKVTY